MKVVNLWIFYFLNILTRKVKIDVMNYFYLIIKKILRGIKTEVVVERAFDNPQGEKTSGKRYWVRT